MSKCPDCGGPDGPKHICRARSQRLRSGDPKPNWSWQQEGPAQRPRAASQEAEQQRPASEPPKVEEIKKVSAAALNQLGRAKKANEALESAENMFGSDLPPQHPDCKRCDAIRDKWLARSQRTRERRYEAGLTARGTPRKRRAERG